MVLGCSGISWTICKQSAPCSRQKTTSTPITQFLQAGCFSWHPTNSVKALKAKIIIKFKKNNNNNAVSICFTVDLVLVFGLVRVVWSADLHIAQLMPLPLTVSCSSKIQIGFTFLVPAHLGSLGQRVVKRVCVFMSYDFLVYCRHLVARSCLLYLVSHWCLCKHVL